MCTEVAYSILLPTFRFLPALTLVYPGCGDVTVGRKDRVNNNAFEQQLVAVLRSDMNV